MTEFEKVQQYLNSIPNVVTGHHMNVQSGEDVIVFIETLCTALTFELMAHPDEMVANLTKAVVIVGKNHE